MRCGSARSALAAALSVGAAELLELTQWKGGGGLESALDHDAFRRRIADECAEVLLYLFMTRERALGLRGASGVGPPSRGSHLIKRFFDRLRLVDDVVYGGLLHGPFPGFRIVAR